MVTFAFWATLVRGIDRRREAGPGVVVRSADQLHPNWPVWLQTQLVDHLYKKREINFIYFWLFFYYLRVGTAAKGETREADETECCC